jgi:hypothetical protein
MEAHAESNIFLKITCIFFAKGVRVRKPQEKFMLIHNQISLHNVAETEILGDGGLALRRIPKDVRQALSTLGRMISEDSAGIELRFVTEAASFRLSLSSHPSFLFPHEHEGQIVVIFRGSFIHSVHKLEPGKINHIHITNLTGTDSFLELVGKDARHRGFSPAVWRVFMGRSANIFYGLETYGLPIRPPTASELPGARWLAYGSSITNGASPLQHINSYVYHAARVANLDVLNLGLSGSCLCEPEIAEYIGNRDDYQVLTLEVGVNMRRTVTPEDFRNRVERLLDSVCKSGRKVFLVTIFPNIAPPEQDEKQSAFVKILRELHTSGRWSDLGLIEGGSVLDDLGDLTTDMIHPSDYGHARMGQLLGEQLRSFSVQPE